MSHDIKLGTELIPSATGVPKRENREDGEEMIKVEFSRTEELQVYSDMNFQITKDRRWSRRQIY